ncbi:hypothetical protein O0L34_g828 [Tuta absoluta]|nr:hypothetical protein O0L34_g828 [Tuta absoluta]
MRILNRCLKQIPNLCSSQQHAGKRCDNALVRQYITLLTKRLPTVKAPVYGPALSLIYYSDIKKDFLQCEKKSESIKEVLEHKKVQLKDTEHRIRQRGEEIVRDIKHQRDVTEQKLRETKDHLIKDILETKAKVRSKFDTVVERDNPFTIPNLLCVTRIAMSPYVGHVILQDNYSLALGLMAFAGVTDLLDGWIARRWKGQSSVMGSFLDPMADKILVATLFVTLTMQKLIPLELTLLIVSRDVLLVIAAFVIRYVSLPPPKTVSRYFDVTYATAQLAPTFISKVNTAIQLVLVGTTLASPVFGFVDHPAMHALVAVTATTTILSALSYVVSKDTYKFLKKKS